MPKRPDTRGFDDDQIDYLVHHAQEFHKPDKWHDEVQEHLNYMESPEDQANQAQMSQEEAIDRLADKPNPLTP